MNFLEELKWRNMVQDTTPGVEEKLNEKMCVGYIGFDPTAPSLTIGNYVQIMLLKFYQLSGHKPIILMGGATGRIGDPSGKDKERQLKSFDELDSNLAFQVEQIRKLLDFDDPVNGAEIVNNLDFYSGMNVLEFLRTAGKTLTINYMSSKESVKRRIETGISYTEFSYQLLQAYDFQVLFDNKDCILQMGGSDQWGNITSGTEFIRRNSGGKAYAITTPLLTKADGTKFGKSEKGNIWLDPKMTSPYQFFQFWLNANDADVPMFYRYFSLKTQKEIEALEKEHADNPRALKKELAKELTIRIHGEAAYNSSLKVSEMIFNKKASQELLQSLEVGEWESIFTGIPSFEMDKLTLEDGLGIIDLLTSTKILNSNGEVRRAIKNNSIRVNKEKVTDINFQISDKNIFQDKYIMVENGKKNKHVIKFV